MSQDHLSNVYLISIEHGTEKKVDTDLVISNLSSAKSQMIRFV